LTDTDEKFCKKTIIGGNRFPLNTDGEYVQ